jgi:transmembrane 9 superfamily protein 2/4
VYTYDVIFYNSDMKWSSRWDHYLNSQKDDIIHWFSILYSILIMLIFSTIIAWILCRVLKKDIDTFNSVIVIY